MAELDEAEVQKLKLAVGECLMAWAKVEFHMNDMFRLFLGSHPYTADLIWGSVVSFDARMRMLTQALLEAFKEEKEACNDLALLFEHTRRMSKRRNEIAHSTLILVDGVTPLLEPFSIMSDTGAARLSHQDVAQRAKDFLILSDALHWCMNHRLLKWPSTQRPASAQPPPDLVQELRKQESQRRKEASERSRLLNHAQKLRAAGQLPDWED